MAGVAEVQTGDLVFGKYRVERALGTGGMGSVFAAVHVQLEQRVALKILDGEVAKEPEIRERFLREARIAAKLQSEYAARVLDIGVLESGLHCIVMEYLEGEDLATVLGAEGPLEPAVVVDYILCASEALAEAHAHGVVHRDLKPANLFLSRRPDGSRQVKIIDFGIAGFDAQISSEAVDRPLTRTRSLVGTPSYMSPEQLASARDVDARSDIWSLGVTLFELLSGERPFGTGSLPEICASILKDEPKALVEARPGLDPELAAIVRKCLQKERDLRFRDLSDLAAALLPFGPPEREKSLERIVAVLARVGQAVPESQRFLQATQPTQAVARREGVEDSQPRAIARRDEPALTPDPERVRTPWDLELKMPPPQQLSEQPRSKRPTLRREEPDEEPSPRAPDVVDMGREDRRRRPSIKREEPEDAPRTSGALNDRTLVPRVVATDLTAMALEPADAFLLSRLDGVSSVQEILDISGMPPEDALRILERLLDAGVISVTPP